ncbi:DUF5789 family protein [Halopenitus persicus]|uniref:Uncharacterized protein n=1 Tax=Halopenitus persicus TaxID=1048396 RepID=A0A1H3IIR9_9EURY|nr:DUF5789 family protein [Halopenitus persicus]QHS17113.1 hypothetical protein GWK26_08135 [haloarchaeon 3A1-DGR]SDY27159.1 hypothetical protein SAMN05216564_104131 [Halopenitus persicus]
MSEDADEEADEPAVELGSGEAVEGQPVTRVASRLVWPKSKSDVIDQEGDATIRTPDGARELADVLAETDETLFDSRGAFVRTVAETVGRGPVATE